MCDIVRRIIFNGFDTLLSGIRISSERSETTGAEIRTAKEAIPFRDGAYITPTGRDTVKLTYCLILHEQDRPALAQKARYIAEIFSGARGDLFDTDLSGKKYMNAVFTGADPLEYVSRNFRNAYMTVHFEADPVPQEIGAENRRILKFAANGGATITLTDNSAYSITIGEDTVTGTYTAAAPYRYRLVAYAENPVAVTRDGAAMTSDVFTLANATDDTTIAIAAAQGVTAIGYGYYELWHDTRGVST